MRGSNCISIHKALTGLDSDSKKSAGYLSISIHKALTGLDGSGYKADPKKHISIHKALTGLDDVLYYSCKIGMVFQSTRPSRASTCAGQPEHSRSNISIHKALTGLDSNFYQFFPTFFSFLSIMLHFSHSTPLPIQKAPIFYALFPAFSSANIPTFPCPLHIRTKKSTVLSHQIQALPLYAPPYFYIGFPDYKISGCLYLYQ